MIIKKFTGKTEAEATEAAKKELGNGLVIMNVREVKKKGLFSFLSPKQIEVTAALEDESPQRSAVNSLNRTEASGAGVGTAKTVSMKNSTENIEKKLENMGKTPIIMTSPIVRMYFKRLTEDYYPDLVVVSYNEVESNVELQSVGMVTA